LDRLFSKDDFGEMEVLDIYILILVLLFVKVPCYFILLNEVERDRHSFQ
jgi:hypothetical protein